MSNNWQVPELKDELERKTLETIEWAINQASSGQMTESEFKVAMQAVFGVTAGLVGPSIQEAMEIAEPNSLAQTVMRRVFTSTDRIFVVSWIVGSTEVHITGYRIDATVAETQKSSVYESEDAKAGSANFHRMCGYLQSKFECNELAF